MFIVLYNHAHLPDIDICYATDDLFNKN